MNFRTILLQLLSFAICIGGYGQPGKPDSLKKILASISSPIERAEILLKLADNYRTKDPETRLFYARKALAIAQQHNDAIKKTRAEFYLASYNYMMGKPEDALPLAEKNIALLQKNPDQVSLL